MPDDDASKWDWKVIVDASESAVFPPWHVIANDQRVKGAITIVAISIVAALLTRFLGPSGGYQGDFWQTAKMVSAVIPPVFAILFGIFSIRNAHQVWQQWIIFGAVAWLLVIILLLGTMSLQILDVDLIGVVQGAGLSEPHSHVIVSAAFSALAVAWLYLRLIFRNRVAKTRRSENVVSVGFAFLANVALFTLGAWVAVFSDLY